MSTFVTGVPTGVPNTGVPDYQYLARVMKVLDGDSVHLEVDQGLDHLQKLKVRLYGINAPELASAAGPPARQHLIGLLGWATTTIPTVFIRTIKDRTEKYGRYLALIFPTITMDVSVNDQMIRDGFAVAYYP